jgi:ADP-heptose:LPS heptosyltransferase
MVEISPVSRTVVLHPGALGDVLLSIPALRALRAAAADDELCMAAQPRIGALLASLGIVDRALDFEALGLDALFTDRAPAQRLGQLLTGARVVSWFGSRDAHFVRRLRSLARVAVAGPTIPTGPLPVWQHLRASVATLVGHAGSDDAEREPVAVPGEMADAGRRALAAAGWDGAQPLVILHPGAGGLAKRWAVEGFAQVAEAIVRAPGASVVVHEGPADRDAVAALRGRLGVPARALVDPPLGTVAGAIHHAALWIGNDSGVTHLAAAIGAPTQVLFIAANLAWRPWAPGARVRIVAADALSTADVDAVIADAGDLPRHRVERAGATRGAR